VNTWLTFSWLHLLKGWSLLKTRGGSILPGLTHIERFPYRVTTMRFRHLLEEPKLDES
jgi:hypothetical protein